MQLWHTSLLVVNALPQEYISTETRQYHQPKRKVRRTDPLGLGSKIVVHNEVCEQRFELGRYEESA